jgi:RsmE family RNA methyltransferase
MNMLIFDHDDVVSTGGGEIQDAAVVEELFGQWPSQQGAAQRIKMLEIRITDERLDRLRALLKRLPRGSAAGHTLRAGLLNGAVGRAEVVELAKDHARLRVQLLTAAVAKLPITLILALPRPKMLRRILRMSTELGVARVVLINTHRVEKSYWQTPVLQPQTLQRYLLEGLTQTGDTVLPLVEIHRSFRQFSQSHLPRYAQEHPLFLAHPGDFPPCGVSAGSSASLCIGPEGGFTADEIDVFQHQGAKLVSLGQRVLRVETAVPVLISRFM